MRILVVSQMWPGPEDPDLGVFVQQMAEALERRGHTVEAAVLRTRAGGRRRWLRLGARAAATARRFRPDVVYAHFLFPTGLLAALASRAPLVVTAHGQDVANVGAVPGIHSGTDLVIRRAAAVIAVSDYLRRELEAKLPAARGKTHVVDCGIDLERFVPFPAADGPTAYVCVGALSERKNVLRLADAFGRVDDDGATLTFVGDGPLRPQLEGRERVRLLGRLSHDRIPELLARSHVLCQPSLVEPFGQALLEAMACGRSVVATAVGGPPEFVTPDAGVLVEPTSEESIADGLRRAAGLPRPNHAARAAAAAHDVNEQARRVEEILARAARGRRGAARPAA